MNTTLQEALAEQANRKFQQRVAQQNFYGKLIAWRKAKINDRRPEDRVLRGYGKIMDLIGRRPL